MEFLRGFILVLVVIVGMWVSMWICAYVMLLFLRFMLWLMVIIDNILLRDPSCRLWLRKWNRFIHKIIEHNERDKKKYEVGNRVWLIDRYLFVVEGIVVNVYLNGYVFNTQYGLMARDFDSPIFDSPQAGMKYISDNIQIVHL